MTRLLVERGADPNDGEVAYHTPESYDNEALKVLVESGKLTGDSLSTMLLRKHDWHDYDGHQVAAGARGRPQSNDPLAPHFAPPSRAARQRTRRYSSCCWTMGPIRRWLQMAGRRLRWLREEDGVTCLSSSNGAAFVFEFQGVERLIAACATDDADAIQAITAHEPQLAGEVLAEGGKLLAEFAGNGNTDGVRRLLDLGVDVQIRFKEGDLYWDVAKDSTALHVAAWRARHATVKFLIERRAPVNLEDGKGRTPLALAERARVDSYWSNLASPESVEALLPCGRHSLLSYAEFRKPLRDRRSSVTSGF